MLPEADLPLRVVAGAAYFDFLGPPDEPWLARLIDESMRFEGHPRRMLAERLAEPLAFVAPHFKRRAASRVLLRLWRSEAVSGIKPIVLRQAVFEAASAEPARSRPQTLAAVAERLRCPVPEIERNLFADLPAERALRAPTPPPTAAALALATNLAIAQAALMRSCTVTIHVEGNTRPIVRLAKWRGLICVLGEPQQVRGATLEISGPFALFKHTLLYGRALAEVLPHLTWCPRFALRASCQLRGRLLDVALDNESPIFPAQPPTPFDSQLEQKFADDLSRRALDWDLVREPEPLAAAGTLIFPDFLLRHRIHTHKRVFVEIIGFWTPEYLTKKLAHLRACGVTNMILCLDESRLCAEEDLPPGAPVVRFRRRIDVDAVMVQVTRLTASGTVTPNIR
ncbi:MAG: DUF790 family protein [Deltaproteobacteria bacterium]|nr:DUF790 family protein [Deltaproteobacteria bacterium]